ncbi:hypothetical protein PALB_19960 [Pseudoalteromonas luteoviolacea B = ATCC 29581]|nr:hypothetical protein PALB_19960 [Pseudoalteromonas luteoviolacea B = ATCC 29581]
MKTKITSLLALCLAMSTQASQIFLATDSHGALTVSPITKNEGYHNQPLITDQGVYYTAEVKEQTGSQMDVFFYDFKTKSSKNLTNSSVSEYSPTIYPYDKGLSAVVVEADGTQRLWFYPFDKSRKPERLFDDLKPVGYHAWGTKQDMILFMLGEPHYLFYGDVTGKSPQKMAEAIGRSLSYNATIEQFSFTYSHEEQHWFATLDANKDVQRRFVLPDQVQDYTWVDAQHIAYAIGSKVYQHNVEDPQKVAQWHDFSAQCLQISRLNYHNQQLAFVCERTTQPLVKLAQSN